MQTGYVVLQGDDSYERLFPAERGRLFVQGTKFVNEFGELFQWRGYSWFLGFHRYCQGQDITPDLKWMVKMGINIPRLFGPLPWVELNNSYTYQTFDFQKLDSFLTLLESYGLRSNWSLTHYVGNGMHEYVSRFFEVASGHWSVLAEFTNEPHNGQEKPDPIRYFSNINRRGILTSYGYYPNDRDPRIQPVLDFSGVHTPRDSHWARKARDVEFVQNATGKPAVGDEPAKIAEPGFHGSGVKNDPTTTPREAAWHFGVLHLWTPGGTVHTQHGRNGLVPEPGTLTHTAVEAVRDNVWKRIAAPVQQGKYTGSHFGTSPVDNAFTPDGDPIWTYSSMHPNKAWSVRCYPSAPVAQNGWRIVDRWGPAGSFVQLER